MNHKALYNKSDIATETSIMICDFFQTSKRSHINFYSRATISCN